MVSEAIAETPDIVRRPAAIKAHWMPVFRADGEAQPGLHAEVERRAAPWGFSQMVPPLTKSVKEVLRRARRTAPGLDGIPSGGCRNIATQAERFC